MNGSEKVLCVFVIAIMLAACMGFTCDAYIKTHQMVSVTEVK
jgi:hypothetical protein